MAIDLSAYTEYLDNALADATPCVVATVDAAGVPDVGLKGSVVVFDTDHLCYWERVRGQNYRNLKENPNIAIQYYNRERAKNLRFFGVCEIYEEGPVRDAIMARTPERELNNDPDRKGVGVLIRVNRLLDQRGGITQVRD